MKIKRRVLTLITISFFTLLFVSTFLSKTIYYYMHEKVTAMAISNGFINNEFKNINANLVVDGGDNIIFPVKLSEPLVVKKVLVNKGEYINEKEAILLFDIDSVNIARDYLMANIENCEINVPVNTIELATLKEQLRIFDSLIDKNGNLFSKQSGFISDIFLKEGDNFLGAGQMYTISNKETNYMIGLTFSNEQGSYIDPNCEMTLQNGETLIKGIINKKVSIKKECSLIVQPNVTLIEEDVVDIFLDNAALPMDIKTSSGRYETIVPVEAIIDDQYIYCIETVDNFLGSRSIARKMKIQILAMNGEMVAIDINNQSLIRDSKVITNQPKLRDSEEIVVLPN
ncbi:MAG: hypothetical protein K0S41_3339 [Anaerocolumna sp.]|nr:hypothetical protein [Anaerocolumna sp.]